VKKAVVKMGATAASKKNGHNYLVALTSFVTSSLQSVAACESNRTESEHDPCPMFPAKSSTLRWVSCCEDPAVVGTRKYGDVLEFGAKGWGCMSADPKVSPRVPNVNRGSARSAQVGKL